MKTSEIESPLDKQQSLKIAVVSQTFPPQSMGGISSSHYGLYQALRDKYRVQVFTYAEPCLQKERNPVVCRFGLPGDFAMIFRVVIYVLLRLSGAKGVLYQLHDAFTGALAGVKVYTELRKFSPDIVIVPDQGAVSALWPRLDGAKVIFASHHNSMRFCKNPLLGEHSEKDALCGRWFEQRAISKADAIVCPSAYMKDVFMKTYEFDGPVEVIPNILDTKMIETVSPMPLRRLMGLSESAPVIYIPSAGSIYKGKQFVFELARRLACGYEGEIGFYLSGAIGNDVAESLKYLPQKAKIYAPGIESYAENLANVKACMLCVSPTLIENFSMALLEAQFCGVPVVTFDTGGNKEIIVNGVTGCIVGYMDVESMVSVASNLLVNQKLRTAMSLNAKRITQGCFGGNVIISKYDKLFQCLIKK